MADAGGADGVDRIAAGAGGGDAIGFRTGGDGSAAHAPASAAGEGALRALAVLVAVRQLTGADGRPPVLAGLECPEASLHPAAVAAMLGALREASADTQIVAASHSPGLLDGADANEIVATDAQNGDIAIGRIGSADAAAIAGGLFSAGDLMRMGQLAPAAARREEYAT